MFWQTNLPPNGSDIPYLRQTHEGAEDPKTEGHGGGEPGRKLPSFVKVLTDVSRQASPENEVLGEGDALKDGQPVRLRLGISLSNPTSAGKLTIISMKFSRTSS